MTELVIFVSLIGGACWGFKQWLAYKDRQQFMTRLDEQHSRTGHILDVTEAQKIYATTQPAKPGGMNKWVVMALCAIYIVCPIDFIPDFIPVLGWGDDLAAAMIAFRQFFK